VRAIGLAPSGSEGYLYSQGGTPRADAEAGIDAWRQTLRFLADARRRAERP
jgi:hypothetical protein